MLYTIRLKRLELLENRNVYYIYTYCDTPLIKEDNTLRF